MRCEVDLEINVIEKLVENVRITYFSINSKRKSTRILRKAENCVLKTRRNANFLV